MQCRHRHLHHQPTSGRAIQLPNPIGKTAVFHRIRQRFIGSCRMSENVGLLRHPVETQIFRHPTTSHRNPIPRILSELFGSDRILLVPPLWDIYTNDEQGQLSSTPSSSSSTKKIRTFDKDLHIDEDLLAKAVIYMDFLKIMKRVKIKC